LVYLFSLQYLHHGICNFDEPGIFVTFEESPLDIIRNAASFGWDLQELIDQNKLFILDASPDPDGQDVAGNFDLSGLIERISYAIRKYKAKRVAIDSITIIRFVLNPVDPTAPTITPAVAIATPTAIILIAPF